MPEVLEGVPHQLDIASGEPADRLPVVSDKEIGNPGTSQRAEQGHSTRRNILELVDQYVAVGRLPFACLDELRSPVDQIVEVDRLVGGQQIFIFLSDVLVDGQEACGAFRVPTVAAPCSQLTVTQSRSLRVRQERRQKAGQCGDLPAGQPAGQPADEFSPVDSLQLDTDVLEPGMEAVPQRPVRLLPAVRLNQPGPVLLVDPALPGDPVPIVSPSGRRLALPVESEVLDVHVALMYTSLSGR